MNHTGTVFLSRTAPHTHRTADGVFLLEMLLYDRISQRHIEPWRVTWAGPGAQRFWDEHKAQLIPGAALVVELDSAKVHTLNCRPSRSEVHANVICAALVPPRSKGDAHG